MSDWCDACACLVGDGSCDRCLGIGGEEVPDPLALPWVFEKGEDVVEHIYGDTKPVVIPYRRIFAGEGDDRCPLADLAEEAPDEVGLLMAQAVPMRDLLRRLWSELDVWRSRDARRMGPALRALQDEIGELLREPAVPGGFEAERGGAG